MSIIKNTSHISTTLENITTAVKVSELSHVVPLATDVDNALSG
jgi:hypothetical protein